MKEEPAHAIVAIDYAVDNILCRGMMKTTVKDAKRMIADSDSKVEIVLSGNQRLIKIDHAEILFVEVDNEMPKQMR